MTTPEDSYDKLFEDLLRESARAAADFDAEESSYREDTQQELVDRHALRRVKGFQRSYKISLMLNIASYSWSA
jgi:GTP-binding protein HflX